MVELKRIKVVVGYAAHARLSAELGELVVGYIPMTVHQPYRFSSTHAIVHWDGREVIVAETKHRRYEVFQVLAGKFATEAEAHAAYVEQRKTPDQHVAVIR